MPVVVLLGDDDLGRDLRCVLVPGRDPPGRPRLPCRRHRESGAPGTLAWATKSVPPSPWELQSTSSAAPSSARNLAFFRASSIWARISGPNRFRRAGGCPAGVPGRAGSGLRRPRAARPPRPPGLAAACARGPVAGLAHHPVEAERRRLGGVGQLEQLLVGLPVASGSNRADDLARGPVSTIAPLIFPLNLAKSASDLASK